MKPEAIDTDLLRRRSEWTKGAVLSNLKTRNQIVECFGELQHKMQGARYHRSNFERREDDVEKRFSEQTPATGIAIQEEDPSLIFEAEAFLYQLKSTLDTLPRLLRACGLQSSGDSFGDRGDRILRQLSSFPGACTEAATEIGSLIIAAQAEWLDHAIALRDHIAHRGMLTAMGAYTNQPYVGGPTVGATYPALPTGERTRAFLETAERQLRQFVDSFVMLALRCATTLVSKSHP